MIVDFTEPERCADVIKQWTIDDVMRWEGEGDKWKSWNVVLLVEEALHVPGCRRPSCVEIPRGTARENFGNFSIFKSLSSSQVFHSAAYLWVVSQGAAAILDVDCSVFQRLHFDDFIRNANHLHADVPHLWFQSDDVAFDPIHHFGFYSRAELKEQHKIIVHGKVKN